MKYLPLIVLLVFIKGCSRERATEVPSSTHADTVITYADGFTISYQGNFKMVEVRRPYQGATSGYKYLLVPKNETLPEVPSDVRVIRTPVSSIVCTSTSHIPLLDYLDETNSLTGFPTTDYISSSKVRARIDQGFVQELGIDQNINIEKLAVLKPDLVLGYTMSSDYGQFKKIETLGVPVVIDAEYLEKHPLGRAEWIKFVAAFFNKEKQADSVFRSIEQQYLNTKARTDTVKKRPTVLSGIVYGDGWFLPGGQNYASKILNDAGCNYIWRDDPSNGFLELSFEGVYQKAHDADLWIGVGGLASLADISKADNRYTRFKPYQLKQVYTYDARRGAKGGSEFLELGYLRPDLILNDLVKIAHPDLLPDHELFFHKKLD